MAGHSKWANIRFRKAGQDAKRGKLFTKLIREITVAARQGGEDQTANSRLRVAVEKAFSANMTRDTIERAIKRGVGAEAGDSLEEIRYEGYGPGGIALMIDCVTDNRNRTVSEVRHCLTKQGGNLGTEGSVSYLFKKFGQIFFTSKVDEEKLMEFALEAGAEDLIKETDGSFEMRTQPEAFSAILEAIEKSDLEPERAEITQIAENEILLDKTTAESYIKLYDKLEALEDVQAVYSNANIPEHILDELS